jgi:uncharacterized protein
MNIDLVSRVAPFVLYMVFIALEEAIRFLVGKGVLSLDDQSMLFLYPIKVLAVGVLLVLLRKRYTEISFGEIFRPAVLLSSLAAGVVVFVIWIHMDFPAAVMGTLRGFDPSIVEGGAARTFLVLSRIAGAVLVVPVMEELFWRSFLIRYIIHPDFSKVALGRFTWSSFVITVVLFGVEHNLFLAGMMAGVVYNVLLYRTRSISACIVAHGLTNLLLGFYVLQTGKWYFW